MTEFKFEIGDKVFWKNPHNNGFTASNIKVVTNQVGEIVDRNKLSEDETQNIIQGILNNSSIRYKVKYEGLQTMDVSVKTDNLISDQPFIEDVPENKLLLVKGKTMKLQENDLIVVNVHPKSKTRFTFLNGVVSMILQIKNNRYKICNFRNPGKSIWVTKKDILSTIDISQATFQRLVQGVDMLEVEYIIKPNFMYKYKITISKKLKKLLNRLAIKSETKSCALWTIGNRPRYLVPKILGNHLTSDSWDFLFICELVDTGYLEFETSERIPGYTWDSLTTCIKNILEVYYSINTPQKRNYYFEVNKNV